MTKNPIVDPLQCPPDDSKKCRIENTVNLAINNSTHEGPAQSSFGAFETNQNMQVIRYVEFFAGIGGWTMALNDAISASSSSLRTPFALECCAVLDHSDLCMSVYQHNHARKAIDEDSTNITSKRGTSEKKETNQSGKNTKSDVKLPVRIERLTMSQMTEWNADVWLMSPPCQPHTRQHSNQNDDLNDSRSDSFLHLCRLLDQLPVSVKPTLIMLENVVGFERSHSCHVWETVLANCDYVVARFHVQPTQVGLPNERPRYYCVAVRQDRFNEDSNGEHWVGKYFDRSVQPTESNDLQASSNNITRDHSASPLNIHKELPELGIVAENSIDHASIPSLSNFLDLAPAVDSLLVPPTVLQRPSAWCFDVVTANEKRTSCFTSGYGKYIKGTGSILLSLRATSDSVNQENGTNVDQTSESHINPFALVPPEERQYDPDWAVRLSNNNGNGGSLRYFSGIELTRLFGFDAAFCFPPHITLKQQWKLVGNSINVRVASKMVQLGLLSIYGSKMMPN